MIHGAAAIQLIGDNGSPASIRNERTQEGLILENPTYGERPSLAFGLHQSPLPIS